MKKIKNYFHHHLARPLYQILRPFQAVFNLKKRTFFDKFKIKTKDGVSFWLYNNAFFWETEMFWTGFENFDYERKTREVWCELAEKSKVILDIGSNTGWFSMMAMANNPQAEIHAFEPQPNVFEVLKKNNDINGFGITCNPIALSDKPGKFPFYNTGSETFISKNTNHGSLNKEWRTEKQYAIEVEVKRLDEYWGYKSKKIDLIKIDVETFEYQVLKGYGKLLFDHRPIIILEIQDGLIGKNILNLVQDYQFEFFHIDEKLGLRKVPALGTYADDIHRNYLICHEEKTNLISKFITKA
ncbi:FkbM family methyltransferase [Cyclobacterium salsum]|uniref:FkbM family methyltransferase n=1 Tax=Cyclobacterium salsum TaxID=2666329 RepID=UPI001391CEEC|nr:FkbM family methyltransferase [Cyclobacterium salsum]